MTHETHISPKHDPDGRRWTVEFREVRTQTLVRENAIRSLDPDVLARIIDLWLKGVTPGAYIVGPHSTKPWTINFPNRAEAGTSVPASAGACSPYRLGDRNDDYRINSATDDYWAR
jgi:hypothetical protein